MRSWYGHLLRISERRLKLRLAKVAKDSLYRSFKKYIQRKKWLELDGAVSSHDKEKAKSGI